MHPRHSLILDQIKLISRTYSSYGTLALDKSLSSRNVLHRYSLTFAAESGDPQSVERPCPVEVMRMMVQAQYGKGEKMSKNVRTCQGGGEQKTPCFTFFCYVTCKMVTFESTLPRSYL